MNCDDCGTKIVSGRCPNCQEELHIFETQYEYLPEELSDSFMGLVKEQMNYTKG